MMREGYHRGRAAGAAEHPGLLDLLDKLNIDTGTFGPDPHRHQQAAGILDKRAHLLRRGQPGRPSCTLWPWSLTTKELWDRRGHGLPCWSRFAWSGTHLTWNREIPNGKLSAADAKSFDFSHPHL